MSRIRENELAPDFALTDQNGETVTLKQHRGRPMVLFFYPKDDTPGCTAEACGFRDSYEAFTDAGAGVIGISSDDRASHERFATKHALPFPILSDPGGRVRSKYGVPKTLGVLPGRTTYVIDPEGLVRQVFTSQLNITGHIENALEAIRSMGSEEDEPT